MHAPVRRAMIATIRIHAEHACHDSEGIRVHGSGIGNRIRRARGVNLRRRYNVVTFPLHCEITERAAAIQTAQGGTVMLTMHVRLKTLH